MSRWQIKLVYMAFGVAVSWGGLSFTCFAQDPDIDKEIRILEEQLIILAKEKTRVETSRDFSFSEGQQLTLALKLGIFENSPENMKSLYHSRIEGMTIFVHLEIQRRKALQAWLQLKEKNPAEIAYLDKHRADIIGALMRSSAAPHIETLTMANLRTKIRLSERPESISLPGCCNRGCENCQYDRDIRDFNSHEYFTGTDTFSIKPNIRLCGEAIQQLEDKMAPLPLAQVKKTIASLGPLIKVP